jgi:putative addiction module killer protein
MPVLREYLTEDGASPFGLWFDALATQEAAFVTVALARIEAGNTSNVKGLKGGIFEVKIDRGPGYRLYGAKDGETLVILLGGGTKRRQQRDIETARARWKDYRMRRASRKGE